VQIEQNFDQINFAQGWKH